MSTALPFVVFGLFVAIFFVQARREGLSMREWRRRNDARSAEWWTEPGRWRLIVGLAAAWGAVAVVAFTISDGFRWAYFVAIPLFAGFAALVTPLLIWISRHNARR